MKIICYISLMLFLFSCGTSNNVTSNHVIQKRKYTKGFHFNLKSRIKSECNNTAIIEIKDSSNTNIISANASSSSHDSNLGDEKTSSNDESLTIIPVKPFIDRDNLEHRGKKSKITSTEYTEVLQLFKPFKEKLAVQKIATLRDDEKEGKQRNPKAKTSLVFLIIAAVCFLTPLFSILFFSFLSGFLSLILLAVSLFAMIFSISLALSARRDIKKYSNKYYGMKLVNAILIFWTIILFIFTLGSIMALLSFF